jgi:quinol-cytochrome oxidoreductase complex cytochrome b subunit
LFGTDVKYLLLGDSTVGQEALLRFYVLHVAVLPVVLTLLATIHFWRSAKTAVWRARRKRMHCLRQRG